jgi:hypothetical protein
MEKEIVTDAEGRVLVEERPEPTLEYQVQEKYQKVNRDPKPVGEELWLRIYVDEENKRYFIDIFAAYSLRMISYQEACARFDRGDKYFEISIETLRKLETLFKNRIHYIRIKTTNKNYNLAYHNEDNNEFGYFDTEGIDNYDDKKYIGEEEINNYKQAFPEIFNNKKM